VTVVVDANIAIKWIAEEPDSPLAAALYETWTRRSELLIAPPIFRPEITNVIHRKVRRGELNLVVAVDALDALLTAVSIHEPEMLYVNALSIAQSIGVSATYDPLYLALAEAERCDLWTADKRFVRAVGYTSQRVRWLGELSSEK
jgi:predicted nucleic acid-binding protein